MEFDLSQLAPFGIGGLLFGLLFRSLWRQDENWQRIVKAEKERAEAALVDAQTAKAEAVTARAETAALRADISRAWEAVAHERELRHEIQEELGKLKRVLREHGIEVNNFEQRRFPRVTPNEG